jgi:predicted nucleic acid-binding protein
MEIIDFNSEHFMGFAENEEILLDTGIILGYLNEYDAWHSTLKNLFENHILSNDKTMFLFINPGIVNEALFLSERPVKNYIKTHPDEKISDDLAKSIKLDFSNNIKELIENEVLIVLDGDKNSTLKQIELNDFLGSADAQNASIANEHGINFLTVDGRLANNLKLVEEQLKDIPKVYYTIGKYRDYK